MSTITREFTKEQLIEQAKKNIEVLRGAVERIPGASDAAVIHLKLAEITLASLEADAVGYVDAEYAELLKQGHIESCSVYAEPGEGCITVFSAPPVAVSVPDEVISAIENLKRTLVICNRYNYCSDAVKRLEDACRAAMLQGAEPVTTAYKLPLDYLQGHKDGLEWASRLAEANHPQTGDWLYDDPLELAKAIRKGPDMPEIDGNSPVIPDGYALVPVELTGAMTKAMTDAILDDLHNVDVWRSVLAAAPQQEVK
ncbi:hypothetical protein NTD78_RS16360 [Enterobacter bugandensis]